MTTSSGASSDDKMAVPKLNLLLQPAQGPIRELVTKFGGQPVWLGEPTWPLDPETDSPMDFVGQIRLEPQIFTNTCETMAYLFVTDAVYGEDTYDPYSGQSAVLLQPGSPPSVPTTVQAEGPTLRHLGDEIGDDDLPLPTDPARCEFGVVTVPGTDPATGDDAQQQRWEADPWLAYTEMITGASGTPTGHKVGGEPQFFRGWPAPFTPEDWRLLLQLDADPALHPEHGTRRRRLCPGDRRPTVRRLLLGTPRLGSPPILGSCSVLALLRFGTTGGVSGVGRRSGPSHPAPIERPITAAVCGRCGHEPNTVADAAAVPPSRRRGREDAHNFFAVNGTHRPSAGCANRADCGVDSNRCAAERLIVAYSENPATSRAAVTSSVRWR